MSPNLPLVFSYVLAASIALAVTGLITWQLLRWAPVRVYWLHRIGWGLVLMQGICLAKLTLTLPVLPPRQVEAITRTNPRSLVTWNEQRSVDGSVMIVPDGQSLADGRTTDRGGSMIGKSSGHGEDIAAADGTLAVRRLARWRASIGRAMGPLAFLWLSGMILLFSLSVVAYGRLLWQLRAAEPASEAWQREWQSVSDGIRSARRVGLLTHRKLGPMLCCTPWGHQIVVPPERWSTLTPQQRMAILRHELAHLVRHDIATTLAARCVALVHWFNPVAWLAAARFEEAAEWACDRHVARTSPTDVPALARAILVWGSQGASPIGVSGIGGSATARRLRRLLSRDAHRDSRWTAAGTLLLATLILAVSIVELRVTPRSLKGAAPNESEPSDAGEPNGDFQQQLQSLAKELDTSDPLTARLREALATPAGQLLASERLTEQRERQMQQASQEAVPRFIEQNIVKGSDTAGSRVDALIAFRDAFDQDVESIRPVLQQIASKVAAQTEAERLLVRFLEDDASSVVLYLHELRDVLRPDVTLVERRLGELFVRVNGQYQLRPGARDEAGQLVKQQLRALSIRETIAPELALWAKNLVDVDERHRHFKTALTDPTFLTVAAVKIADDEETPTGQRMDAFFEQLENLVVDTADGLQIRPGAVDEIDELLQLGERLKAGATKLAGPVREFSSHVAELDDLHRQWKRFLATDMAAFRLAEDYEAATADPEAAVRALLDDVLTEDGQGHLHLRPDRADELVEHIRGAMREYRSLRRRGRLIGRMADQVQEPARTALNSLGGQIYVLDAVQQELQRQSYDGLEQWKHSSFERSPKGFVIRPRRREQFQEFLRLVDELDKELKKDDF